MSIKIWSCVWLAAVWWCVAAAGRCDVTVGNYTYRVETLLQRLWWIQSLAVDHNTHTVYISYRNLINVYNGKVDLRSKVFSDIEELRGRCSYTVDQGRGEVHAGCSTDRGAPGGLYQWDSNTGQFELTGEEGRNVCFAHYYNNTMFYSYYPRLLLHTFIKGQRAILSTPASPVLGLIIDGRGDHVFFNSTGVYRWQGDGTGETRYDGLELLVPSLAVDGRGAAYLCDAINGGGIWRLHDDGRTATKLLDAYCTGLAFDAEDNIICTTQPGRIVRLVRC